MADEIKPATLAPAIEAEVADMAGELVKAHHKSLEEAVIRFFWMIDKPLDDWGRTKVASEEIWWLSGGPGFEGGEEDAGHGAGADIIIKINESLWKKLTAPGRQGLLDHLLSGARRKEGGKTEMSTEGGPRLLYEAFKPSLGLDPVVIARNPTFVQEVIELRKLCQALADPQQFTLDLNAPAEVEVEEEEEAAFGDAPAAEAREPVFYFGTYTFPGPHGFERAVLRFTSADKRPETLVGVHLLPEVTGAGLPTSAPRSELAYDTSVEAIRAYRMALEGEQEEKRVEVLARDWDRAAAGPALAAEEENPAEGANGGSEAGESKEIAPAEGGGELLDMASAGRRGRRRG